MSRRLTHNGRAFLLVAIISTALGVGLHYRELLVLAVVFATSLAWAFTFGRAPAHLNFERTYPVNRITEGSAFQIHLRVSNTGRSRSAPFYAREFLRSHEKEVQTRFHNVPSLQPGESCDIEIRDLDAPEHGCYTSVLQIGKVDALRLVRSELDTDTHTQIWVHPRIHPMCAIQSMQDLDSEVSLARAAPDSFSFDGVREYQYGDDVRLIHWLTTARAGKPMVRQRMHTSRQSTVVFLDTFPAYQTASLFRHAVRATASILSACAEMGIEVFVRTSDGRSMDIDSSGDNYPSALDMLVESALSTAARRPTPSDNLDIESLGDGKSLLCVVTGAALRYSDALTALQYSPTFASCCLVEVGKGSWLAPDDLPRFTYLTGTSSQQIADQWNAHYESEPFQ